MKFKAKLDIVYIVIYVIVGIVMLAPSIVSLITKDYITALICLIPFILILFMIISMVCGYARLDDDCLFIKYGFVFKRSIPYEKIRSYELQRKFYCESLLSLKNAMEHVEIKYNKFDNTCVSVRDNIVFLEQLHKRIEEKTRNLN